MSSKSHQYINSFYLAVHFLMNIVLIVGVIDLIDTYIPVKHLLMGYHIDLHQFYARIDLQKIVAPIIAAGVAIWYYQKRKSKADGDPAEKH